MQSVHVLYMTYVGFYLEVQTDVDSQDDKPSESNPRWVPRISTRLSQNLFSPLVGGFERDTLVILCIL